MTAQYAKLYPDFHTMNGVGDGRIRVPPLNGSEQETGDQTPELRTMSAANQDTVARLIREAVLLGSNTLDLSNKMLSSIPEEVMKMSNLEYLYLEGNCLSSLPDNFFDCLPNLKWLDLRHNYIASLPTVYIARHRNLHNLLLESNQLKSLPLELGMIPTLQGLNIASNPIEFPPNEILEQGTKEVLRFLREMLISKSQGHLPAEFESLRLSSDSNESPSPRHDGLAKRRNSKSKSTSSRRSSVTEELVGPIPSRSPLHTPANYHDKRLQYLEKLKKAGALGPIDKNSGKHKLPKKTRGADVYPEPPPPDIIDVKIKEERKAAKRREMLEKQDAILQRRRDDETLKEFRDETKRQQQKKFMESLRAGKTDYTEPLEYAPFGIDQEYKRIPTNEERIKLDIKSTHERVRQVLSPRAQQQLEAERYMKEKELESKIKTHSMQMKERRKKPKGTPQQEMNAAKKELEMVKNLQGELMKRYYDLKSWSQDLYTGA